MTPDPVEIGCEGYEPGKEDDTGSWAELAQENAKVRYLLRDWIPFGMLTGIIGEPKAGKSAFVLGAIVRPVITGHPWFTGQGGSKAGYVVWCDTEHRAALNLQRAAEWKLPTKHILTPFTDKRKVLNLDDQGDIDRISVVVCRYKAKLVVVDSYRGAHKRDENNSTITAGLQSLASMCEETKTACLVIHHARKMSVDEDLTINAGRGSNAFLAAVACQIAIDRPDPQGEWRRVQVLGENLGIAPPPTGFRFTPEGLDFGQAPTRPKKETKKGEAADWLRSYMEPGRWYPSAEIDQAAVRFHFSQTALQRAKEEIGMVQPKWVRKVKTGWECRLPEEPR